MSKKSLRSITEIENIKDKVVIVRADYNVTHKKNVILDTQRIDRTFKTLDYLLQKGAKIVLISHIGRPNGKRDIKLSLKPVYLYLKTRYSQIKFSKDILNAKVVEKVSKMKTKDMLLLENIRFSNYETADDELFAKKIAELGDYYVNDAFGVSHRRQASVHAITKFIKAYAGFNLIDEIKNISLVLDKFKKPASAIIGGVKISTKINVIEKFLKKFEHVMIGGALANNFLKNKGYNVGASFYEKNYLKLSKSLLNKFNTRIVLPVDVVISKTLKKASNVKIVKIEELNDIKYKFYIVDVGPSTIVNFKKIINESQTLVWNGPLGLFEVDEFANGTFKIARIFAKHVASKPYGLIGGGETIAVIDHLKLSKKIDFISTGGGAMLEYIEKGDLPALKNLYK